MPILSVADLLTVATYQDALNLELSIAAAMGLPTTAWQPLDPEIVILGVNAELVTTYSAQVNVIAQGGFPTSAATIPGTGSAVDGQGYSTTWMDLCLLNYYNVVRVPAAFATGNVPVNSGSLAYTISVGQLHFQNAVSGATYTNTTAFTLPANSTAFNIPVQADGGFPGTSGTSAQGTTLVLLTPLSGVSVQPLAVSLIGTNVESNASALARGQAKLASLSPNGASGAYAFVATSVPTPAARASATLPFNALVDSLGNPITVTAPITRVATFLDTSTGSVGVYVANAEGAPSSGDVAAVFAAEQALATPQCITMTVSAAGEAPLNVVCNVWVKQSSGLSASAVLANINAALSAFCATAPIGGETGASANIVPYDQLVDLIFNANPGTVDLHLLSPASDMLIATTAVPVPGTPVASPPSGVFFV